MGLTVSELDLLTQIFQSDEKSLVDYKDFLKLLELKLAD